MLEKVLNISRRRSWLEACRSCISEEYKIRIRVCGGWVQVCASHSLDRAISEFQRYKAKYPGDVFQLAFAVS